MTLDARLDARPHPAKLTARDFWLLADAGAFANNARTELIEGEIWAVNSVHRWHARTMLDLGSALKHAVETMGVELEVLAAGSVSMTDDSVPEPDLSVIEPLDPEAVSIGMAELRLAVEISDTTAAFDLGRKARLYARCGVPEYWVVVRETRTVVQLWSPAGEEYRNRLEIAFGDEVRSTTIPGLAIRTDQIR